jgi:hypothetical protein
MLKLYRLDEGGAVYWLSLALGTCEHARDVIVAMDGALAEDYADVTGWKLVELSEEEGRALRFAVFNESETDLVERSIWDEHLAATVPTVHSCSEWD